MIPPTKEALGICYAFIFFGTVLIILDHGFHIDGFPWIILAIIFMGVTFPAIYLVGKKYHWDWSKWD